MRVNLCHSVVPQASNVILQCMHVYKVILSHSNGSSSARRLEVDGRLHMEGDKGQNCRIARS